MELRPFRKLCCAAALAGLAAAPSAQLELSFSEGVMGYGLEYHLSGGNPSDFYFLLPSFQTGPIPLSTFEPGQAGDLLVGFDLLNALFLGQLDGAGTALIEIASLPTAPGLVGLPLRAHAFSFTVPPVDINDLSNPVELTLQLPGSTHFVTGDMEEPRRFSSMTTLADGNVFVAGGMRPNGTLLSSYELFDASIQRFGNSGDTLPQPRAHHKATLLLNNRVILTGGIGPAGVHATVAGYDPAQGIATNVAPMNIRRVLHTTTRLADGRLFVAGGAQEFTQGHPIGWPASVGTGNATATTEIYNPVTNTWTFGPSLPFPLIAHSAVLLGDDRVVIAGGIEFGAGGPVTTAAAYLFDPSAGSLTRTLSMDDPRFHQADSGTTTGDALFVGGTFVDFTTLQSTVHDDTWRFDAQLEQWFTHAPMLDRARCGGLGCLSYLKHDENGNKIACTIYLFGGGLRSLDMATGTGVPNRLVMQLKDDYSAWTEVTDLQLPRLGTRMAPVDDGIRMLFVGSAQVPVGSQPDQTAELITVLP